MKLESFPLQFIWRDSTRQVQIRTEKAEGAEPVIAVYQVFWNDSFLFSIYPTFDDLSRKSWEIVEKERAQHLPPGFITVLGSMIDDVYVMN